MIYYSIAVVSVIVIDFQIYSKSDHNSYIKYFVIFRGLYAINEF
jgi:hypothetical protein